MSASSHTTQSGFAAPQETAAALIKAAGDDLPALKAMVGPEGEDLVSTPDPVQDKSQIAAFAERAQRKNSVQIDPKNPGHATLLVRSRTGRSQSRSPKEVRSGTSMQKAGVTRFCTGESARTNWTQSKFVGDTLKRKRSTLRPFMTIPASISTRSELSARLANKTGWLGRTQMAAPGDPWEKESPKR